MYSANLLPLLFSAWGIRPVTIPCTDSYLPTSRDVAREEMKTTTDVTPTRSITGEATIAPSFAIKSENSPTESIASPENTAEREEKPNRYAEIPVPTNLKAMFAAEISAIGTQYCPREFRLISMPMDMKNSDENTSAKGEIARSSSSPLGRDATMLPARNAPMDGVRFTLSAKKLRPTPRLRAVSTIVSPAW